jgi:hypothetical protein
MKKKTTKKRMIGGADIPSLTKEEVLSDPKIKQALQMYASQGGARKMQMGGGWWGDFTKWLKDNKVISIGSKVGSAIANATGYLPLGVALAGVSSTASSLGYGKRMRGGNLSATSIAYPSVSSATPYLKF